MGNLRTEAIALWLKRGKGKRGGMKLYLPSIDKILGAIYNI